MQSSILEALTDTVFLQWGLMYTLITLFQLEAAVIKFASSFLKVYHFGFAFAPRMYAMWVLKWQTWWSVNSILCIPNTMELLKALFSIVSPFLVDFKSPIQSKEIESSFVWGRGLGQISLVLLLCSSFFYQISSSQVLTALAILKFNFLSIISLLEQKLWL